MLKHYLWKAGDLGRQNSCTFLNGSFLTNHSSDSTPNANSLKASDLLLERPLLLRRAYWNFGDSQKNEHHMPSWVTVDIFEFPVLYYISIKLTM